MTSSMKVHCLPYSALAIVSNTNRSIYQLTYIFSEGVWSKYCLGNLIILLYDFGSIGKVQQNIFMRDAGVGPKNPTLFIV